jgi:alpha,alpha-trehalase
MQLTPSHEFTVIIGDRSMREGGYDPSCRFGQFNVDIIHYAPVCLNSLLYRMELDMAKIQKLLGNSDTKKWEVTRYL